MWAGCGMVLDPAAGCGSEVVPLLQLHDDDDPVPHRNRLDLVELHLPLQNLLDLAFLWTLLHLLSANQVQEFGGEDEIPLHRLWGTDG